MIALIIKIAFISIDILKVAFILVISIVIKSKLIINIAFISIDILTD